jgi:CspA family cold shock protein
MQWVSPERFKSGDATELLFQESAMAEGKIKRLTEKGFGFIETGTDKDMFFHTSSLEGVRFEDLREGQRVSYTPGHGPKGPRAENVRVI